MIHIDNILVKVVAVILTIGLLYSVIYTFNNTRQITETMVIQENTLDKLKQDSILSINDENIDTVKGGDVIAAIRHYQNEDIKITVKVGNTTRTYTNTLYKASDFSLPEIDFYESIFNYSISGTNKTITFIKQ